MKKSKKIILAMLVFVVVIALVYITSEVINKTPMSVPLAQNDDPIIFSEPTVNDIMGVKWSWEKTVIGKDKIVFPRVHEAFIITFTEDGVLNGKTDCNNFSGQYKKEGDNMEFGLFLATQMYCEESQEEIFKKSLAEVEEFSFDENGRLILKSVSSLIVFVNKESEQNNNNWNLIKQAVAACNIKEGGQTHDKKVRVKLKNSNEIEAYSPKIDDIFEIVNDAKERCGKVTLWTE